MPIDAQSPQLRGLFPENRQQRVDGRRVVGGAVAWAERDDGNRGVPTGVGSKSRQQEQAAGAGSKSRQQEQAARAGSKGRQQEQVRSRTNPNQT